MKEQRVWKIPLFIHLLRLVFVAGMSDVWVDLRAPRFVVHRNTATLHCDHNVDADSIYKKKVIESIQFWRRKQGTAKRCFRVLYHTFYMKNEDSSLPCHFLLTNCFVVFYKDGRHFMRYIRNRDPPYELSEIAGAHIDVAKMTSSSVTLESLDFPAAGSYACEIALETPLYSKVSKIHELNIIVRQKHRPKIKIKDKRFSPNDFLDATCQSAGAHPAPHLTWFINNAKVDEKLTVPHGTINVHRHHHGMPLTATSSSLHYPLPALGRSPNQTVDITCSSTIPSYASVNEGFADVMNTTISVSVWRIEPAPTQLPVMIVGPENAARRLHAARILTLFVLSVYF